MELPPPILPRAVLFDMDGTLTEPLLDFPAIKRAMGIGPGPILEALSRMTGPARAQAEAILHRFEDEAAAASTLNRGCTQLLDRLAQRQVLTALITRNRRSSVQTVLTRHRLKIEVVIAREDAEPKPSPQPLWLACRKLGVDPTAAWMVGDGYHDIEAAAAAGIRSVWISHGRPRDFAAVPDAVVNDLLELAALLCPTR